MTITAMLDSNVCIRAMRSGGEAVRAWLAEMSDTLCLSTIVVHELLVGAELSARAAFHRQLVGDLTALLDVRPFDAAAAGHAAAIRADLQRRGAVIGGNDLLIAGHARSLGLRLVTADTGDFGRVTGLSAADWNALDPK